MRVLIAFIASLFAFAGSAAAEPTINDLFPNYQEYLSLPEDERSHFTLRFYMRSSDGVPPEIEYGVDNTVTAIDLDETGRVLNPPPLSALAAETPVSVLNRTEDRKFSMNMQLAPALAVSDRLTLADIETATEQANAAIRRVAGVMAFAAPKMRGVVLMMPEDAAPPVLDTGEALAFEEDYGGYLARLRDMKRADADAVLLSVEPLDIRFVN